MTMLTPARRAHLASIGRLGGLTFAATNDTAAASATARSAFDASFLQGHGCKVCPPIEINQDLDQDEIAKRAGLLRTLHFSRLARARHARRA